MSSTLALIFLLISLIIIVALTLYAYTLWGRVKQQQTEQQIASIQQAKKQHDIYDSLFILAQAIETEQINITEAAIRISALVDALEVDQRLLDICTPLRELNDATVHMARGEARKTLSKQDRMKQDWDREKLEVQYQEQIMQSAQVLHQTMAEYLRTH